MYTHEHSSTIFTWCTLFYTPPLYVAVIPEGVSFMPPRKRSHARVPAQPTGEKTKMARYEQSDLVLVYSAADTPLATWLTSWIASPSLVVHHVAVDGEDHPDSTFWEDLLKRPQHSCILLFVSDHLAALYRSRQWKKLWSEDMQRCRQMTRLIFLGERIQLPSPEHSLFPRLCVELYGKSEDAARLAIYDALTGVDSTTRRAPFPTF